MTFTKQELSLWMPIFQAFLDGKTIQRHNGIYKKVNGNVILDEDGWIDYNFDILDFSVFNHCEITNPTNCFRIKPEVEDSFYKNACERCHYHEYFVSTLNGKESWRCMYTKCKYGIPNANPEEPGIN